MMKFLAISLGCLALLSPGILNSCGYRAGGVRPECMKGLKTFNVEMFKNYSTQPMVSMQLTTALTNALQADGTYKLASPAHSDFVIRGEVLSVTPSSLTTDWRDSYLSSEIGLTVKVHYEVVNKNTGKTAYSGTVSAQASYYNLDSVNVQNTRDNALSYAARKAADSIASTLSGI